MSDCPSNQFYARVTWLVVLRDESSTLCVLQTLQGQINLILFLQFLTDFIQYKEYYFIFK